MTAVAIIFYSSYAAPGSILPYVDSEAFRFQTDFLKADMYDIERYRRVPFKLDPMRTRGFGTGRPCVGMFLCSSRITVGCICRRHRFTVITHMLAGSSNLGFWRQIQRIIRGQPDDMSPLFE